MSSLGLPTLAHIIQRQEATTHVEERLQGLRMVPVMAGEGYGGDCQVIGQEL